MAIYTTGDGEDVDLQANRASPYCSILTSAIRSAAPSVSKALNLRVGDLSLRKLPGKVYAAFVQEVVSCWRAR
jgi:hypothetical protein